MEVTLPNLQRYAERIGAEFFVITERKFPDWPVTYEKMQVFELGHDVDWNVFIDADTVVHDDFHDVTSQYTPDTISYNWGYDANTQLRPDSYFARDGRNIGIVTNFVVSSAWTHDIWEPLQMTPEEALENVTKSHYIDEYAVSRNLAKYGLKYGGICPTPESQKLVLHLDATHHTEEQMVTNALQYLEDTQCTHKSETTKLSHG